jgi:hypothetical protein
MVQGGIKVIRATRSSSSGRSSVAQLHELECDWEGDGGRLADKLSIPVDMAGEDDLSE